MEFEESCPSAVSGGLPGVSRRTYFGVRECDYGGVRNNNNVKLTLFLFVPISGGEIKSVYLRLSKRRS